jgi:hypothetical protein
MMRRAVVENIGEIRGAAETRNWNEEDREAMVVGGCLAASAAELLAAPHYLHTVVHRTKHHCRQRCHCRRRVTVPSAELE